MGNLDANMERFPEVLERSFGTLPNIHTVVVGNNSAAPFVEVFLLGSDEDPIYSPTSIAFPAI